MWQLQVSLSAMLVYYALAISTCTYSALATWSCSYTLRSCSYIHWRALTHSCSIQGAKDCTGPLMFVAVTTIQIVANVTCSRLLDMFSALQRRHSFSATRNTSIAMGREDHGSLTTSHKSRFHRRQKSGAALLDSAQHSRDRKMSLPGTGNEKSSKKEGGGWSLMELLKFKKRRKSTQESKLYKTGLKSKVSS